MSRARRVRIEPSLWPAKAMPVCNADVRRRRCISIRPAQREVAVVEVGVVAGAGQVRDDALRRAFDFDRVPVGDEAAIALELDEALRESARVCGERGRHVADVDIGPRELAQPARVHAQAIGVPVVGV